MPVKMQWVESLPAKNVRKKKAKPAAKKPRFFLIMNQLKQHPGHWANVINYHNRFQAVNAATTFRNNGFQAAVRKGPGGWYKVFARYVEVQPQLPFN